MADNMDELIKQIINRFYGLIKDYHEGAPDTRYKSWEWCHKAFIDTKKKYSNLTKEKRDEKIDYLALHLAFYLASWGMYRGSSYLLQRDYKAHKNAVRIILESQSNMLWDYEPTKDNIEKANGLLFGKDGVYWNVKESYKGYSETNSEDDVPSETLVTKILMGTFGCTPAFDRFFKAGISHYKEIAKSSDLMGFKLTQSIETKTQGKATQSFMALASFAKRHDTALRIIKDYPPMKCVDMFFWEIGYEKDLAEKLRECKDDNKKRKLLKQAQAIGYQSEKDDCDSVSEMITANLELLRIAIMTDRH